MAHEPHLRVIALWRKSSNIALAGRLADTAEVPVNLFWRRMGMSFSTPLLIDRRRSAFVPKADIRQASFDQLVGAAKG
jgi:hypothetical protein